MARRIDEDKASCDKLDAELKECLTTIWNAYRKNDFAEFNRCFAPLYEKYRGNKKAEQFIGGFGFLLVSPLNYKILDDEN